ncbi:MAG: hypothetical protein IT160_16340 [Bryobacterales bacterium]|nr:hypothetical protein [Bryobacterales bacterium]
MNCVNHPDLQAVAFCRTCGKALCGTCRQPVQGTVFCAEHAPVTPAGPPNASPVSPWTAPAPAPAIVDSSVSPGLAFVLGWIPGVGAIYNGQYAKGLVHVVVIGLLISIQEAGTGGLDVLVGLMIALWFFYMAFEAYHTAKKRQLGLPVDEFSSLFPVRSPMGGSRFPIAPLILIVLGVVFLLNNLEIIHIQQMLRYWPVLLIVLGIYMFYMRITDPAGKEPVPAVTPESETHHE